VHSTSISGWLKASAATAFAALLMSGPAPAQDQVTIGALYLDAQGFYGGIKKGIETGAADQNIRLLGQNSQGDAARESQFASTLVSSGVKAIIMSPVSATASVPVVREAHEANIPVICYNTCINDDDAKLYVYALVTTDQYALGYDAGVAAGEYFIKKGVAAPRFGILGCDVYEACRQRKAGFKDAVTKAVPGVVWAADQDGYEAGKSTETATNMLTGDAAIDGLFANNENGVIGAMQGVIGTDRLRKVAVFGNDIDPQIAQYMLSNPDTLIATNGQQPQEMGKVAVEMALKAIKGEKNDTYLTNVPTELFTSTNPDGINAWLAAHADGIP
jgi:ABC-type sugar transport system substrate-binding protein